MKYILSRKEWERLNEYIAEIDKLLNNLRDESAKQTRSGDVKYDTFIFNVRKIADESERSLNNLKELTS